MSALPKKLSGSDIYSTHSVSVKGEHFALIAVDGVDARVEIVLKPVSVGSQGGSGQDSHLVWC